jgi:uncharacterized protein (DUF2384 family)
MARQTAIARSAQAARPRGRAKIAAQPSIPRPEYFGPRGTVDAFALASHYRISRDQLAQTAGLPKTTLSKSDRRESPKAQERLREIIEVLRLIENWAGGEAQALAWYRSQPIPALDGRTAEALVQNGEAAAVRNYLDHLALGGFA